MSKMNRAVFNVLRNTINEKLPTPPYKHWQAARIEWKKYAEKELNKKSKKDIIEAALKGSIENLVEKRVEDFRQSQDTRKEKREQLLKEVDKAELLFLAGDNTAVLALIDKLDKL